MKKHHTFLLLLFACIAALLLKQTYQIKQTESQIQSQLNLLRDAVKKSPVLSTGNLPNRKSIRSSSPIDTSAFLARLDVDASSEEFRKRMEEFADDFENQISNAPLSKLKELCAQIEKNYPLDQTKNEMARKVWLTILGEVSQADPAWAFDRLEKATLMVNVPISEALGTFQRWSTMHGESMRPAYASALETWLKKAQTDGKIEEDHPLVVELRANIAAAQGNTPAAVQQLSKLPFLGQQKATIGYLATLQTPHEIQQAMEQLSTTLHPQNFPQFAMALAEQQGFEAAREILTHSSLTPEKFDIAAAGMAAAKIGPDTAERAQWLLEHLRSDDPRALTEFAKEWTHGSHSDAAGWIGKLPQGKQRDAALAGFIPAAASIDGATTMDWALTVSDPDLRRNLYYEAHTKWQKIDAPRADQYLRDHPLGATGR